MLEARAALNLTPYHAMTPQGARQSHVDMQAALPPGRGARVHAVQDHEVAVAGGTITVRTFKPRPDPSPGTILYMHGGGWVIGTIDTFEPVCRELAVASGLDVASVNYRLAPDHPFPGPVEDAYAALKSVALRSGGKPIVVMGDSAGANLAAALALKARDEAGPDIALQVMIYPVTDADFETRSYVELGTGQFGLSAADMRWFWDHYVPDTAMRRNPLAAPLHAPDVSRLPPAIVAVAGCDPLHDEGVAYAERLRQAGVSTALERFDDMMHGFFTMVDVFEPANAAIGRIGAEIGKRVGSA